MSARKPSVSRQALLPAEKQMLDPNRPRKYEVLAMHKDGTMEALEIISVNLKIVTDDAAIFQIMVAAPSGETKP